MANALVLGNGNPAVADSAMTSPFEVLLRANNVLLNNLRRDEASPELQKQLTQTGMPSSAQAYFCDPYANSYLGPQIRPKEFAMLPAPLARERDRVECMTFMGLLPEIDHAWMTVDNVLFLWNYHTQDFTQYRELEQVIVTVALVPPKRGVFQESVKHVLAVATTVEVVMLAVTYQGEPKNSNGMFSGRNRRIQIRPTNFRVSTDGVSMLKMAAHPNGRVFMAGKDGNMYELNYSVSYGFLYSVFFVGDSTGSRKCKRVMHKSSGAPPSPVHALLALLGLRSAERTLVDIVVDPLRNVLYTLDMEGNMDLFDLGVDGNHTTQKMSRFNIWEAAFKFCRWGSPSNLLPDQSIFKEPGRFIVVSVGVVDPTESKEVSLVAVSNAGMRFYLSCGYNGGSRHNFQLNIVQIRCPPPEALWRYLGQAQQQRALTTIDGAAVVASAAARVVGHFGAQPQDGFPAKWERQASATPSVYDAYSCHGVTVLAEAVGASGEGNRLVLIGQDLVTRSKRRRDAHQEEHPMMREAVTYEGGGDDESGASGGGSGGGGGYTGGAQDATMGKVWAISERPVALSDNPSAARLRALLVTSRTPSHAEINGRSGAIGGGGGGWGGWGGGRGRERGGVFFFSAGASRQSSGSGSRKVNGGRASATSTSTALVVRGATTGGAVGDVSAGIVNRAMQWRKSEAYPERPVAPAPPLVCSPGGSRGCPGGLVQKDVARVVALPELGTQSYSERRELLCLTSAGLQTFVKLRAVDLLYDLLAQNQAEKVSLFFDDFSPDQSAAMCFSIACGLPRDLGGGIVGSGGDTASGVASSLVPSHTVRARALEAAVMNCKPPGFSSPQAAGGAGGGGIAAMEGVTIGEKFNNSALHNGLQLFIARLLRPFWFRPVIASPGGGGGGGGSSGSKRSADGKSKGKGGRVEGKGGVGVILDLEALRGPLELLQASIRNAFPRAVGEDLAAKAAKEAAESAAVAAAEAAMMSERRVGDHRTSQNMGGGSGGGGRGDVGRINGGGVVLNGGIPGRYQHHRPETPQQRHQKALKMEALEVHAAYRLVTRTTEAVRMIDVLARVGRDFPKAKMPWGVLAGAPLWKLVAGGDEHRGAASLLADLVGPKVDLPPDVRDSLARDLGAACPTYFSQGDVRTFEGVELLRRASELRRLSGAGAGRVGVAGVEGATGRPALPPAAMKAAEHGASLLTEAAKDWRGERALGDDGQLARACAALVGVGRLDALVDVCMTCARNFDEPGGNSSAVGHASAAAGLLAVSGGPPGSTLALMAPPFGGGTGDNHHHHHLFANGGGGGGGGALSGLQAGAPASGAQPWEAGVYQGGGVVGAAEREKARLECYQRVLDTVLGLLQPATAAAAPAAAVVVGAEGGERGRIEGLDKLVGRCLSYDAPMLHEKVFGLLETHDKGLLLRIKTPAVELYLRKEPELLFRYCMLHKEYPKAVYLMEQEAHVDGGRAGMHVRDRVDCISKAISACHKCDLDSSQMVMPGWTLNHAKLQALKDGRDVLLTQERLLRDLRGSMAPLERLKREGRGTDLLEGELGERTRVADAWTTGIVDPTELYGKATMFFLWEGCLQLLQCCEKDEPALARKLIRSIIWREVPRNSREGYDSRTQEFIERGRDRPLDVLEVDDVRQELEKAPGDGSTGRVTFEDDGWFGPLLDKMAGLSRELLGRKASYVLPVDTLCLELQQIADAFHDAGGSAPPLCVVQAAKQAGVSGVCLLDSYESMNRNWYPRDEGTKLRWLEVMVELLKWTYQEYKPGLLAETAQPERLERLAEDTHTGLESLRLPAIMDGEASYKIDALKRQMEALLQSLRPRVAGGGGYR